MHSSELVECVVVGDTSVGKTRLICSYVYDEPGRSITSLYQKHHVPTVFAIDQYSSNERVRISSKLALNDVNLQLRIWDTFGDHTKNRIFAYQNANVVIICFSIGNASSWRNVTAKWKIEIKKYCSHIPIILVGTQLDRRYMDANVFKNFQQIRTLTDVLQNNNTVNINSNPNKRILNFIPPDIGRQTSLEINAAGYFETSIVTKYGVNEVFENALKIGFKRQRFSRSFFCHPLNYVWKPITQKPLLPDKPESPIISIPHMSIKYNYLTWLHDTSTCDIIFMVQKELIHAHCVVLISSCVVFYTLLTHPVILAKLNYTNLLTHSSSIAVNTAAINGIIFDGIPRGFQSIDILLEPEEKYKLIVKIQNVSFIDFKHIIEFCYTGKVGEIKDQQSFCDSITYLQMTSLINYASTAESIRAITNELVEDRQFFMKHCLHQSGMYADITFHVEQKIFPAHSVILASSSPVIAGMFRNNFKESVTHNIFFRNTDVESFQAVIEYLYTGECQRYADLHGTLELANFLCLPRLVALCEDEIAKYIIGLQRTNDTEMFTAVIASYNVAQLHNAHQLAAWCLHYMAVNYNALCKEARKEMKSLDESAQKYLEEHRWPPVWYLKEQDYYERTMSQLEKEKMLKEKKRKCRTCFSA